MVCGGRWVGVAVGRPRSGLLTGTGTGTGGQRGKRVEGCKDGGHSPEHKERDQPLCRDDGQHRQDVDLGGGVRPRLAVGSVHTRGAPRGGVHGGGERGPHARHPSARAWRRAAWRRAAYVGMWRHTSACGGTCRHGAPCGHTAAGRHATAGHLLKVRMQRGESLLHHIEDDPRVDPHASQPVDCPPHGAWGRGT